MRGVFSTGVLDGFLNAGFNPFDLFLGVSSGASNLSAYLAKMPKRNFIIFTDHSVRPEFINFKRFLLGGHLMDLDWLWDETIARMRLDLKTIDAQKGLFLIGLTDVRTGCAIHKQPGQENLEEVLKASCAMPVVYRSFPLVDGRPVVDGGIADPLPVKKAIQLGAEKIMVIRSRPRNYVKKEALSNRVLLWKLKAYPALAKTIASRAHHYNTSVALIHHPPKGVSMIEICPPDDFKPARFGRNKYALIQGYRQGLKMAVKAMDLWGR